MDAETWVDCPGCPGAFEVSDMGRVREKLSGELAGFHVAKRGGGGWRAYIDLPIGECALDELVARAFCDPHRVGGRLLHIDGRVENCAARNLVYF